MVCAIIETESSTFKDQCLSFKIIVGGALVTQEFADAIGPGYRDIEKSTALHMRKKKQHSSPFFNHIASIEKFDILSGQFLFLEGLYENWYTSV